MSKQSHIKNFFKVKSADEIEVEELLLTQISRASRDTTLETAKSISITSTNIISIMDLSKDINNIIIESLVVNYDYSDDHNPLMLYRNVPYGEKTAMFRWENHYTLSL